MYILIPAGLTRDDGEVTGLTTLHTITRTYLSKGSSQ